MRFGQSVLPLAQVQELATSPEYPNRPFASRLLQTAKTRAAQNEAVVAMARGRQNISTSRVGHRRQPQFFLGQLA